MFGDWSLSLEMQFYVVFPALLLLARRFGYGRLAITLTGLGLLCRHVAFAWYIEPAPLPFLLDYFLIGMLLHEAIARRRDWLVGVCLLIIGLDEPLYGRSVLLLVPFALVIWGMGSPRWSQKRAMRLLRRCLENRLFDLGADLSYGLYLIHGFFISAAGLLLFQSARFLSLPAWERLLVMSTIVLAGSAAVSYLAHVFVERPGIRFGALLSKRLGRKGNFSAAEAVPTVRIQQLDRVSFDEGSFLNHPLIPARQTSR